MVRVTGNNRSVFLKDLRLTLTLTSSSPNAFRVRAFLSASASVARCPPSVADLDTANSSSLDWSDSANEDDRMVAFEVYPTPTCTMGATWSLTLDGG